MQVEALADAAGVYWVFIQLLAYTGLRWGEACGIPLLGDVGRDRRPSLRRSGWRCRRSGDLADVAALMMSELIANAVRHTSCHSIRLTVGRPSAIRVRVGVVDRAPLRLPVLGQSALARSLRTFAA